MIAALFGAMVVFGNARGDVLVDPPQIELGASQLEAKTGDLVTITVRSGSRMIEETRSCPPPVNNSTPGPCTVFRNETFLPSTGPVRISAVRANGAPIDLLEDPKLNLTAGTASFSFRVEDRLGFDVIRIAAEDESTGAVAVPLQVRLVFSEEQRYAMWRDALRQVRDQNAAIIGAGEANRNFWTGFTIATIAFLDLVVVLLVSHRLARQRRGMSWVDRVRLVIPLRVRVDPTKYVMDEKDSYDPKILAESKKQRILHDTVLRRRAIVDSLEGMRDLLRAEDSAKEEVARIDMLIRETRERFGLPAESEKRGKLRSVEGI